MPQFIHQIFEQALFKWPDLPAVEFKERSISYLELNQKANQLAEIIFQTAQDQPIIGISTTRGIEMVIGVLAILKAGKAYLPINPTYPVSRLGDMIDNAKLTYCLCFEKEASLFKDLVLTPIQYESIKNGVTENQDYPLFEQRAYVLYTSGSTGKPKGVELGHPALVNLLLWQKQNSAAGIGTRTLQFAPLTFDASFEDSFSTLITGGTLVLVEEHMLIEPEKLLLLIDQKNIHRIFLPFVALQYLTDTAIALNIFPKNLRYVITAGEQLKITPQVVQFFSQLKDAILFNQYGPTETHVVTCLKLEGNPKQWPALPTIGVPLPNTGIHILDEKSQVLPNGEIGELCISGTCLANGYLNNEALTNEKFVHWQMKENKLIRIYKTGDNARYLPDGNIEFLGRVDDQVKILGHRIEPAEIEVVLTEIEGISQAVVLALDNGKGSKRLVAYVVEKDQKKDADAIKKLLQKRLPAYMIPPVFVWMDSFPKTSSGKVDKKALPKPEMKRPDTAVLYKSPATDLEKQVANIWSDLLFIDNIGVDDHFFELGGNSLLAIQSIARIQQKLAVKLPITALYQYPTIAGITRFLNKPAKLTKNAIVQENNHDQGQDIAIIAMAGRFPGADTIESFWELLKAGKETVSFFSKEALDAFIPEDIINDPDYVPARGIINHAQEFDAEFFGFNPKQALLTDPQQRIFLELAWEVLEKTGYLPSKYAGRIGLFGGTGNNTYYQENILTNKSLVQQSGAFQVMTYNEKDYVATRAAFVLNLQGPAVSVHSACSTSLLAIAQAVDSIRNGDSDIALAGGVAITSPIKSGHLYQEGAIFSKDGHTCTFDTNATGTVFSDGAGMVLLKNKAAAERDGDTIYALIKGRGVNNDGAGKGVFTAPSADGQAYVISKALANAGLNAHQISYVEAHGTATPLGDPIELEGLRMAFEDCNEKQFCAVGSVKSNIGHLTAASGVAGFIKTVLALYHQQLPASINCTHPNEHFNFESSPFYINTKLKDWSDPAQRFAGVSSFGVGGTNVHVILASYQNKLAVSGHTKDWQLVTLSAKSDQSLAAYQQKLVALLEKEPNIPLADIAYTLQLTRTDFNHRTFFIASDGKSLLNQFNESYTSNRFHLKEINGKIAFLFPGQGAQFTNMGVDLYAQEPIFKQAVDTCAEILLPMLELDIRTILYPISTELNELEKINDTKFTQPAIFVVEYAMACLWKHWGIMPAVLIGHSIGEFVAAHLAGVFDLKDALSMIANRGKLMSALPNGCMLAVRASVADISDLLKEDISIAAINSANALVLAGPIESVYLLTKELDAIHVANSFLKTSHAFHSSMMGSMIIPFSEILENIVLHAPTIPIISTVTGHLVDEKLMTDKKYWAYQIMATVQFAEAMNSLLASDIQIAIEVGPGNVTSKLLQQRAGKDLVALGGLDATGTKSGLQSMLNALGQIWLHGVTPNWMNFYASQKRVKLDLPTYAFNRKTYWLEPFIQKNNTIDLKQPEATIEPIEKAMELAQPSQHLFVGRLVKLLEDTSGLNLAGVNLSSSFIELGLDSLLLTQIAINLKKEFAIPISFRQLNESLYTIELLVNYLENNVEQKEGNAIQKKATINLEISPDELIELKKPFGASAIIEKQKSTSLTPLQELFLEKLIDRYNKKTIGSKNYTGKYRDCMADPRVVSGFKSLTKEIVYPIVVNRSKGSWLWDIDGNAYIDTLNGFGSNLLGYQPELITKALQKQIEKGYEVGPQHELAGEVCKLICGFTGFERTALCNTGSEAVLGAMRIARTVTGRSIIVAFSGSYHGIIDEVIVRSTHSGKSFPAAAGIMQEAVQNMLILEYGTEESLQIIAQRGAEIAAVLVEPVQSRRPEFQPIRFLQSLRRITKETGAALIFDEVITGFRMHGGGAQSLFGIKADLGTYGKVIAGGLPIGVISGKKNWMDALDGGTWQYGNDSIPEAGVTYFAGTFVRHPLALAASKAMLEYMLHKGPALQEGLTAKTQILAGALNQICKSNQLPIYIAQFGSLWKIKYKSPIPYSELLFTLMRENGIHIWDGFPCFLTEAHTEKEVETIIEVFDTCIKEMIAAGFFVPDINEVTEEHTINWDLAPIPGASIGRDKVGNPFWIIPNALSKEVYTGPPIEKVIPVTASQLEIWLSCYIGGEDANRAYNESISLRLNGPINIDALQKSMQQLVNRHEALRAVFSLDGKTMSVYEQLHIAINYQDYSGLSNGRQYDVIEVFNRADARKSFNLLDGPLARFTIFKLSETACYVSITVHHIVGDGWSLGVLLQDLGKFYTAKLKNQLLQFKGESNFSSYAKMQNTFKQTEAFKKTEAYWLNQFKDEIPTLNLQTDFSRPPIRTYQSQRNDYPLRKDLIIGLRKMGTGVGCSFVTSLLAAFEVYLQKISRQKDIIVGLPTAGQLATGMNELVGHCVNLLPIKSSYQGEISFSDYLKRRKTELLNDYEHQQISFGTLLQKLNISRDASLVPLVPIVFNIDLGMDKGVSFDGLKYELLYEPRAFENFEIFLNASGTEEKLVLEWSYNTRLFKPSTINRMMNEFEQLLANIIALPNNKLNEIHIGKKQDLFEQAIKRNPPATYYPKDKTLAHLIQEMALNIPDCIAIEQNGKSITYQTFNQQANQLAGYLSELGIKNGHIVAVAMDRSIEMVITLLAIQKLGAAYLPIDVNYPMERIEFMLNDAAVKCLLVSKPYKEQFKAQPHTIIIEDIWEKLPQFATENAPIPANGNSLAYVLYTSGSSGRPKGVEVEQHSLVNLFLALQHEPGISIQDRFLAITTIAFDIAAMEIFLPLIAGATLVLANDIEAKDGRLILEKISQDNISIIFATPASWQMVLEAGWDKPLPIKALTGGENLPVELADKLLVLCKQVWNLYGPTETTILSTAKRIKEINAVVTIGKPMANTQVYILDESLQPLPETVIGNIYIAGDGLARGYINNPTLTNEKFIQNPFQDNPAVKMYQTGDLGIYLNSGEIVYMGRSDDQVKIRGLRIELGEIEHQLKKQDAIKDAIVIVRDELLVAFFIPTNGFKTNMIDKWKLELNQVLPRYMVPNEFYQILQFPLTPNGKVNKKALPKNPQTVQNKFEAPRNSMEEIISIIWMNVLKKEKLGVRDNFFELGGHSNLAVMAIIRLEKETGIRLPVSAIFQSPTIEELSKLAMSNDKDKINLESARISAIVPLKPTGTKPPLLIVHGFNMSVLMFMPIAKLLDKEQPVYGLQPKNLHRLDLPMLTMEELATEYIQEILEKLPSEKYALAGYSFGGFVAFEMAKQLRSMGKTVTMLAMFDCNSETGYFKEATHKSMLRKVYRQFPKMYFILKSATNYPEETITYQKRFLKNKWRAITKNGKSSGEEESLKHISLLDIRYEYALLHYQMHLSANDIDLFRVQKRIYFVPDQVYLGWRKYTMRSVFVHEVPGDHKTFLMHPNQKEFAKVLQSVLNKRNQ